MSLIRNKNSNWATSPSKLRLSQHRAVLFVPSKVSQDAYWEKSYPLLSQFRILKSWTSYQTYLPKWLQVLLKNNVKLLLGQDFLTAQSTVLIKPWDPVNYHIQHNFSTLISLGKQQLQKNPNKQTKNPPKPKPEANIFRKPALVHWWRVTYSFKLPP